MMGKKDLTNLRSIVEKHMENIINQLDAELIVDKCYASVFFNKVFRFSCGDLHKYVHWCEISGCHRLADGQFFSPRFVMYKYVFVLKKVLRFLFDLFLVDLELHPQWSSTTPWFDCILSVSLAAVTSQMGNCRPSSHPMSKL
jgi:hypothetical protein